MRRAAWAALEFPAPEDKEEAGREEVNVSSAAGTSLAPCLPGLAAAEQSMLHCLQGAGCG